MAKMSCNCPFNIYAEAVLFAVFTLVLKALIKKDVTNFVHYGNALELRLKEKYLLSVF